MVSVMCNFICIDLSIDLFVLCVACRTVFVNCLVKQFVIYLGEVVTLSLNVECGGATWVNRPCMVFQ